MSSALDIVQGLGYPLVGLAGLVAGSLNSRRQGRTAERQTVIQQESAEAQSQSAAASELSAVLAALPVWRDEAHHWADRAHDADKRIEALERKVADLELAAQGRDAVLLTKDREIADLRSQMEAQGVAKDQEIAGLHAQVDALTAKVAQLEKDGLAKVTTTTITTSEPVPAVAPVADGKAAA